MPVELLQQMRPWLEKPPLWWDPILWDAVGYFAPSRKLLHESVTAGHLPLWNPYELCGTPFLANIQSAVLYPLGFAFWLWPPEVAFGVNALLHLFLAGVFTYLWLRAERVSRWGAVFGAVVFAFGGWSTAWLELPVFMQTAVWLPLALCLAARQAVQPSALNTALMGAVLGCMLLGGHLQIAFYCILGTALYTVVRPLFNPDGRVGHGVAKGAGSFAAALVLAVLLASPQLLPSAELARYAHRQDVPTPEAYSAFVRMALPPQNLVCLFMPGLYGSRTRGDYWGYGNYAEYALYVGILPLMLAGLAVLRLRRSGAVAAMLALEAVGLLLALGTVLNRPLYFFVPGFAKFGMPSRALVLHAVAFAGLAAVGWDELVQRGRAVFGLVGAAVVLAFGGACWWIAKLCLPPQLVSAVLAAQSRDDWLRFLLLVGASGAVVGSVGSAHARKLGLFASGALLVLDLWSCGWGLNPVGPRSSLFPKTALTSLVGAASPNWRVMPLNPEWPLRRTPKGVLPPNTASVYGLYDVGGYESLYLRAYKEALNRWHGRDTSPLTNGNMVTPTLLGSEMLNMLAVRFVIAPGYLEYPGRLKLVGFASNCAVYENTGAHPRAQVFTQASGQAGGARVGWEQASVVPQKGDPNRVRVKLHGRSGKLVLRDVWYPGWTATAHPSGRSVRVEHAEGLFTAALVQDSDSEVEFAYRPFSFKAGLFLGFLAVLAIGFVCGYSAGVKKEKGFLAD